MKRHRVPVRFTGQHFTIDTILINDAIRLANIQKEDLVLDIGAGCGFLTVHLAKYAKNVLAIENDSRLVSILRSKFNANKKVIVAGVDYRRFSVPPRNFKVVSNIPFGITAEILKSLMYTNLEYFKCGCLVMQLAAVKKLIKPKFFNPHIVFYHTFFELKLIYEIGPESFMPPPTVKSALLQIRNKKGVPDIGAEMKEKYLSFLHFMLKFPDMPVRTVLKKIFRKQQVWYLAVTHHLKLDDSVCTMSPAQFLGCFIAMLKVVPGRFHPTCT